LADNPTKTNFAEDRGHYIDQPKAAGGGADLGIREGSVHALANHLWIKPTNTKVAGEKHTRNVLYLQKEYTRQELRIYD
jgi:hypothetical protein